MKDNKWITYRFLIRDIKYKKQSYEFFQGYITALYIHDIFTYSEYEKAIQYLKKHRE
jgi:hypothetical protein